MQGCAFTQESAWGRCLAQFLATCSRSQSEDTYRQYSSILSYFLSHPAKMPEQYTQEDVLNFIHAPCRGYRNYGGIPSVATINQRLAALKSFYAYAATYTVEGPDGHPTPLLAVMPPTLGMRSGKPRIEYHALSYEEMERLFAVIPTDTPRGLRDRALFLCYFWTARRRMEIARLLWGDIERAILIDEDEQRRAGWVYHFRNKGRLHEDDVAELPLPAKLAIDKYLVASGRMETIKAGDPVFVAFDLNRGVRFDQTKPLSDESIARCLKYWVRKAGLDTRRITLHSLRHTAAKERYASGEKILSVNRLLRHASLDMTYRYVNKLVATADDGAKRLEARFSRFS